MWIVAIIIAVVVFAGYMLFDAMMAQREQRELTRQRIYSDGTGNEISGDAGNLFGQDREKSDFARNAEATMSKLGVRVDDAHKKLTSKLVHAGITNPNAVAIYLIFQRLVSPILIVIGVVVLMSGHKGITQLLLHLLVAILLMVVGLFGPKLFVENMISRRKKLLTLGFPDTLDLLLVCVEAGLALDAALSRVCGELGRVHPEVTKELNRARVELSLLNNRSQALHNLAERTDLVAYRYLVAALIQSERFGTSLSDTLRVMSDEYRTKRIITAEEKAARIPVFMTIPLIFCLMPSFMLIILGPAIIAFLHSGFLSN